MQRRTLGRYRYRRCVLQMGAGKCRTPADAAKSARGKGIIETFLTTVNQLRELVAATELNFDRDALEQLNAAGA